VVRRRDGFTLIELVVVLAILGVLISLAVPRYMGARKNAYKAEAENVLQEMRTLEWAYYQQFNLFDTVGTSMGFAPPGGMHWFAPAITGTATALVTIIMSGSISPLGTGDMVSVFLYSDGSSAGGSTF
jgi:prepilin-type N-terminal cleavage/methylation domain-containing protein